MSSKWLLSNQNFEKSMFFSKGPFKNDVSFCLLNKPNPLPPLGQQVSAFGLPPYPPMSAVSFWLTPLPPLSAVSFPPTPPLLHKISKSAKIHFLFNFFAFLSPYSCIDGHKGERGEGDSTTPPAPPPTLYKAGAEGATVWSMKNQHY